MQIIGYSGNTVDGTRYGFVLVAATLPSFDSYQDNSAVGQRAVSFNNIMISGGTNKNRVDVDGGQNLTYSNDGLLFQNPTTPAESVDVNGVLQNLQVVNFPGNALSALDFNGEFRGYNVYAGGSGGNCVDIENKGNPYRFYGLVVQGCRNGTGVNLVSTGAVELHGASIFGNNINISVSGTTKLPEAYIVLEDTELAGSQAESMYLDQQNETVVCASHCIFRDMNLSDATGGEADSAIVVGPDAVAAPGAATAILRLTRGTITPVRTGAGHANYLDVRFSPNAPLHWTFRNAFLSPLSLPGICFAPLANLDPPSRKGWQ
jgi:hypothetical protein